MKQMFTAYQGMLATFQGKTNNFFVRCTLAWNIKGLSCVIVSTSKRLDHKSCTLRIAEISFEEATGCLQQQIHTQVVCGAKYIMHLQNLCVICVCQELITSWYIQFMLTGSHVWFVHIVTTHQVYTMIILIMVQLKNWV